MTDTTWATTIAATDNVSLSRTTLNDNFAAARRISVTDIDNGDSPYTASDDDLIVCDASSGAITVNLPDGQIGDVYSVIKSDASGNAITIDADSADTINGSTTRSLSSQWDAVTLVKVSASAWVEV